MIIYFYLLFRVVLPFIIALPLAIYSVRKRGIDFLLVGILPLVLFWLLWDLSRAISFPGYCDQGDGCRCVSGGMSSYFEDQYSPLLFLVPFVPSLVCEILICASALCLILRPRLSRIASLSLLVGLGILFVVHDNFTHEWNTPESKASLRTYLTPGEKRCQ